MTGRLDEHPGNARLPNHPGNRLIPSRNEAADPIQELVDEAFPTGGTTGPNAWTEERIRERTRFAEACERILGAAGPAVDVPAALDVERLVQRIIEVIDNDEGGAELYEAAYALWKARLQSPDHDPE